MPPPPASADEAEHVLACLHQVRLDTKLGNGRKFSAQDICFAERTGSAPAQGCAFFRKVPTSRDDDADRRGSMQRRLHHGDTTSARHSDFDEAAAVHMHETAHAAERQAELGSEWQRKVEAARSASTGAVEDMDVMDARRRLRDADEFDVEESALASKGDSADNTDSDDAELRGNMEGNVLLSMPDGPLQHNLRLYRSGNPQAVAAVEELRRLADEAAEAPDETVTSKKVLPPTGDKRTYYSLDTYAWPSNGDHTDLDTPWITRDGYPFDKRIEIAPDPVLLINVISRVSTLGQAYFFTGDERYAARAAAKVRTFFLDEHTGMYPSLAYAGMKPGVDKIGKPMGTINFRNIPVLLDGIRLIQASGAWADADEAAWQEWLGRYKAYLESDHVRGERCSLCNHGLYYDLQMLSITRYLGRHHEARRYLDRQITERLRVQMRGGMLPNEMMRPTSLFYVNFVAEGLVRLAAQAEVQGVDLWTRWSERGDSVLDIWDWATSFWCDEGAAWILPQKADVRLGISNPGAVEWIGLPFTAATRDEAHSHRGLVYGRVLDAAKTLMSNGGDSVKVGAQNLMRARLDSCLFNDCPATSEPLGPPPTWVGGCAALDGVANVQTTEYDFTIPETPKRGHSRNDPAREPAQQEPSLRVADEQPDGAIYSMPLTPVREIVAQKLTLFSDQQSTVPVPSLSVMALCMALACMVGLRFVFHRRRGRGGRLL